MFDFEMQVQSFVEGCRLWLQRVDAFPVENCKMAATHVVDNDWIQGQGRRPVMGHRSRRSIVPGARLHLCEYDPRDEMQAHSG